MRGKGGYLDSLDHLELHDALDDDRVEVEVLPLLVLGHSVRILLRLHDWETKR